MHDIVGRAWSSTRAEHGAVTCMFSGHRKSQNIQTCTQELWVRPGYNIQASCTQYNIQACCTQAGPPQAAGRGDGMDRWQHSSLESSDQHSVSDQWHSFSDQWHSMDWGVALPTDQWYSIAYISILSPLYNNYGVTCTIYHSELH